MSTFSIPSSEYKSVRMFEDAFYHNWRVVYVPSDDIDAGLFITKVEQQERALGRMLTREELEQIIEEHKCASQKETATYFVKQSTTVNTTSQ